MLEDWELAEDELTQIVYANPSLRGFLLGYVAEHKARKLFFAADERAAGVAKYDNHDRSKKGDIVLRTGARK